MLTDGPHVGDPPTVLQSADVNDLNRELAQLQARVRVLEGALREAKAWLVPLGGPTPQARGAKHESFWAVMDQINAALSAPAEAHDRRVRAAGAAEALEDIARDHGIAGGRCQFFKVVYREFPDVLLERIGAVRGSGSPLKSISRIARKWLFAVCGAS